MTKVEIEDAVRNASINVLETMFFAEAEHSVDGEAPHTDPLACLLHCSGAEDGTFTVAIDRAALALLCCAFYGEDEATTLQENELICELTNMLAGSTLSVLVPTHYCELSSPQICSFTRHVELGSTVNPKSHSTTTLLTLDGGVLSVSCSLRKAA